MLRKTIVDKNILQASKRSVAYKPQPKPKKKGGVNLEILRKGK